MTIFKSLILSPQQEGITRYYLFPFLSNLAKFVYFFQQLSIGKLIPTKRFETQIRPELTELYLYIDVIGHFYLFYMKDKLDQIQQNEDILQCNEANTGVQG